MYFKYLSSGRSGLLILLPGSPSVIGPLSFTWASGLSAKDYFVPVSLQVDVVKSLILASETVSRCDASDLWVVPLRWREPSLSFSLLLPDWDVYMMVGAGAAFLDHKMEAACWRWLTNKVEETWISNTVESPVSPWLCMLRLQHESEVNLNLVYATVILVFVKAAKLYFCHVFFISCSLLILYPLD